MTTVIGTGGRGVSRSALASLQDGLRGQVIRPDHGEYDRARRVWNGSIDRYPADFTPNGGSTTAPTSVKVTHYVEDPPTHVWYTTAYAICASLFKTPG